MNNIAYSPLFFHQFIDGGAKIEACDKDGETPLQVAVNADAIVAAPGNTLWHVQGVDMGVE